MMVDPKAIVALAEFPLLWRWTQAAHAMFAPDELASIRPIRPDSAADIWAKVARVPLAPARADDRLVVEEETERQVVRKWLECRVPEAETDLILIWGPRTAALVGRALFIDRWDDFWYPTSDDLSVLGVVGRWRIEMYHYGTFDFCENHAFEPDVRRP